MPPQEQVSPYKGPFGIVRRIDDAIFAVEQAIVWTFLSAMTFMVFLDVVYRRLSAPDSKLAELLARIGGVESVEAIALLKTKVAPTLSAAVGLSLLWFGFWTAERHRTKDGDEVSTTRPILLSLVAAAVLGLLGWVMARPDVPSKYFYAALVIGGALWWVRGLLRDRPDRWPLKIGAAVIAVGLFLQVAYTQFPYGYSWSKELSLILLLWVGFLGASICAHEGKHLRLEALNRLVPDSMERWVRAAGYLFTALVCLFMATLGYIYVSGAIQLEGRFEQTNIPDWIAMGAVPAAFALTMLRYLGGSVSALFGGTYGTAPEDESIAAAQQAAQPKAAPEGASA